MTVMTGKDEGAPTAEVFPELTRDVIDRMGNAKSARLQEVMEIVIRHLACDRQGSEADAGRVVASHRLPYARRQDVLRKPPGAYLALGHSWRFYAR